MVINKYVRVLIASHIIFIFRFTTSTDTNKTFSCVADVSALDFRGEVAESVRHGHP
jgi:hypothetical protein